MTGPAAGLVHLGVLYDGVDDLVAQAVPEIRAVLDEGGDVTVTVERSGVRLLREALGDDADRVAFPAPAASYAPTVPEVITRMRRDLRRDRRSMILGQYSPVAPPSWDSGQAEDSVNLLLGDLPLTVLCACASDGSPDHRALVRRCHPDLLEHGRVANAGFRAPDASSPVPLRAWGPPAASMLVSDGAGLAGLRARVVAAADDAGLGGDARDAAVLAAHEAVLLAAADDPDAAVPLRGEHHVEVRVAHGAVFTEVRVADPRSAGEAPATPATTPWRHDLLARLCDRLTVHHGADGRRVRVVTPAW